MAYGDVTRIPWPELRIEEVREGPRRQMKLVHLPTNQAVTGVGEHTSSRQLRESLTPKLLEKVNAYLRAQAAEKAKT